jgi:hypothetical protein
MLPQHPDLIEKQRRIFSDAIRPYAAGSAAAGLVAA